MPSAQQLIQSLRAQPLLVVLRPAEPLAALAQLEQLQSLGLVHVEIAWQPSAHWSRQMGSLIDRFPDLQLGAASVCEARAVADAAAAGCRYAVSPVLDELAELLVEKETVDAEQLQELLISRDVTVAAYV